MQILVKGKLRETPVKCQDCDTIYSYTKKDVVRGGDRFLTTDGYVECPICKNRHYLK